jgi:hypothetical protein
MTDPLDRDTQPAEPVLWTMIQTCGHCGGLLMRQANIDASIKQAITKALSGEDSPAVKIAWEPQSAPTTGGGDYSPDTITH